MDYDCQIGCHRHCPSSSRETPCSCSCHTAEQTPEDGTRWDDIPMETWRSLAIEHGAEVQADNDYMRKQYAPLQEENKRLVALVGELSDARAAARVGLDSMLYAARLLPAGEYRKVEKIHRDTLAALDTLQEAQDGD